MRLYPPLFFQRIWLQHIEDDFSSVSVKINKSFFNINYHKTIFGGTIFSAVDPFCTILLRQRVLQEGIDTVAWLKSATVNYLKPGHGNLHFTIKLDDAEVQRVKHILQTEGKFIKSYPIELYDEDGVLCAELTNEVYLRNKAFKKPEKLA